MKQPQKYCKACREEFVPTNGRQVFCLKCKPKKWGSRKPHPMYQDAWSVEDISWMR